MASQKTATEQVKQFYYDVIDSHRSVLEELLENVKNNNWEGNVPPRKAKAIVDNTLDVMKEALEKEMAKQEPTFENIADMLNDNFKPLDLMYNTLYYIDETVYTATATYLVDEQNRFISDIEQRPKGDPKKRQDLVLYEWCDVILEQVIALTSKTSDIAKDRRDHVVNNILYGDVPNARMSRDDYERG